MVSLSSLDGVIIFHPYGTMVRRDIHLFFEYKPGCSRCRSTGNKGAAWKSLSLVFQAALSTTLSIVRAIHRPSLKSSSGNVISLSNHSLRILAQEQGC